MKRIFFILSVTFAAACNNDDAASTATGEDSAAHVQRMNSLSDSANYTAIQWIDSTYQDIGTIKKGQEAEITWRLKNSGTKPLIIAQVAPGCGCTVADKPEAPIMPGGEGTIKAKFSSSGQHEGEHRKYISVNANTSGGTNHQLIFRAQVVN